ncbi:hypothetical protein LEL_10890 [Akanthomyces lecanii RCEF 1005]|uniref:Uncharacterized protein n=1 Tax=Akanthomyces lecanii RCEF 1005 TaxID=1081108 RepID=A0A167R860_CORDF|nr:hypothetical protein LEL_10890 [Akanthomyces lecanii RCEF 1005]
MKALSLFHLLLWSQLGNTTLVEGFKDAKRIYELPSSYATNESTTLASLGDPPGSIAAQLVKVVQKEMGNEIRYAATASMAYKHPGNCWSDYKWKTAHLRGSNCTVRAREIQQGSAIYACNTAMEYTITTKHSSKYSSTRSWKVTAKESAEYYIGMELSEELSSSYTQEYVDEVKEQQKQTLYAGSVWTPMIADAYLVCSGQYLEDATWFNTDGYAYYRQTENYHDLLDHEDSMCRGVWGRQSHNVNTNMFGGDCNPDTNTFKCTHPTYGLLYQFEGQRWENLKLEKEWEHHNDFEVPLLDAQGRGVSMFGWYTENCSAKEG